MMKTPRESRALHVCSAAAFGTMKSGADSDCDARREMKQRLTPNLRRFCHCRSSNLHKFAASEALDCEFACITLLTRMQPKV